MASPVVSTGAWCSAAIWTAATMISFMLSC
jgi:hypothetical protein